MRKAAGAGKCAFEMIFFFAATGCTPPKTSRPALLCKLAVFSTYIDVDQGSLINKKNEK